jgi:MEMO1 family protein
MKYLGAFLILLVLFGGAYSVGVWHRPDVLSQPHHVASYAHKDFYLGLEQPAYTQNIVEKIYGGIISHHLLTAADMGKFFAELTDQNVGTVVIIGPNHFTIGQSNLAISRQAYDTPWGVVPPDLPVIDTLVAANVVAQEEEPFVYEHSIGAIVPFVAHHLPNAKLVPIVVQSGTNPVELDSLVSALLRTLPDDAVVIASVDFSHHLNRLGADFHDQASLSAIQSFDLERVLTLEIDSPGSMYTLLSYLAAKNATQMSLRHTNSTLYTGNPASEDVTSYLFAHVTKGAVTPRSVATTLHVGDVPFDQNNDPFEFMKGVEGNFLRGVDAIIANLTGPLSTSTDCHNNENVQIPTASARVLGRYIDGVNLASLYSKDCGKMNAEATTIQLKDQDIFYFGLDMSPHSIKVGDIDVAVIGIRERGLTSENFSAEVAAITALQEMYDQVVVHIDWDDNLNTEVTEQQRQLARQLVDAGADVLIGHQPQILPSMERYKDSLIFYSLGTFIPMSTEVGSEVGVGVGLVHMHDRLGAYIFPHQSDNQKPRLLSYDDTKEFCNQYVAELSANVRDVCYIEIDKK